MSKLKIFSSMIIAKVSKLLNLRAHLNNRKKAENFLRGRAKFPMDAKTIKTSTRHLSTGIN